MVFTCSSNRNIYKLCLTKFNMRKTIKRCPHCKSSRISYFDKGLKCNKCGYINMIDERR
jgi:ribosomal protein S27AE